MTKKNKIVHIVNGPNMNLLGEREPEIYGCETLERLNARLSEYAAKHGATLTFFQSNHEGELVDYIQSLEASSRIIINPAAYAHTSLALPDALRGKRLKAVEVHISNIHARESYRQHSYLSSAVVGVIAGLGTYGYFLALEYLLKNYD